MATRTCRLIAALLITLVASGCGGQDSGPATSAVPAVPDHLVGLHASDLLKGFRERGLVCTEPVVEREFRHYVCESSTPLVQYRAEFYAKVPGRVEYIRVLVAQSGDAKLEVAAPLLAFVVNQRYQGADPEAARTWLEKAVAAPGQTEIGPAKLKVSGDLQRLVFELKAAGSEW